jgi:hypothetical protein
VSLHLPSAELVVVRGTDLSARVEVSDREEKIDHVWITMACGLPAPVTVSVNTLSIRSRDAGFDPRVRVGILRGTCARLPQAGFEILERFDYGEIEARNNIFYETLGRGDMESLLLGLCSEAGMIEAWGLPYRRKRNEGIHQVHSRRASCAVPEDIRGRDGGLKFFARRDGEFGWTMVLSKFCGQP